jgi:hypothetical protein
VTEETADQKTAGITVATEVVVVATEVVIEEVAEVETEEITADRIKLSGWLNSGIKLKVFKK